MLPIWALVRSLYLLIPRPFLPLYVERIPNRGSKPTWLIRESKWVDGKSRKITLANITQLPEAVRNQIRDRLKGGLVVGDLVEALKESFPFARRLPPVTSPLPSARSAI